MEIQRVNYSTPSFGAIRIDNSVAPILKKAINESPTFQRFGKKFDGEVKFLTRLSECEHDHNIYPSVILTSVKPVTLLGKIKNFFKAPVPGVNVGVFAKHGTSLEHLAYKIKSLPADYLESKYNSLRENRFPAALIQGKFGF